MVQDVLAEAQNSRGSTVVTSDELKPVSACDNVKLVLLELGNVKHMQSRETQLLLHEYSLHYNSNTFTIMSCF